MKRLFFTIAFAAVFSLAIGCSTNASSVSSEVNENPQRTEEVHAGETASDALEEINPDEVIENTQAAEPQLEAEVSEDAQAAEPQLEGEVIEDGQAAEPQVEDTVAPVSADFSPELVFTTTDREGNTVTEEIFRGKTLTVLNFWESWCGPCVREMPELEQLQQNYAERGVQLIGIYSDASDEQDIAEIIQETGVNYPILHYCDVFDPLQTGYVPTTVFLDGNGHFVYYTLIGSMSYEQWEATINKILADLP